MNSYHLNNSQYVHFIEKRQEREQTENQLNTHPIVRIGINPTTSRWTTERRVVCLSVYVSHACARVVRQARACAASTHVIALGVRALCVLRRAWKSDRDDARTTTRSTRLLDTVVTLASVEYIYIRTGRVCEFYK